MITGVVFEVMAHNMEVQLRRKMMESLSPEAFEKWDQNRTAERRHQEICRSIERAGSNARFRFF